MYLTPEMFGAPANGVDDDGPAITAAFAAGRRVWLDPEKTYVWSSTIFISANESRLDSDGAKVLVKACHFNNNNPYIAGDPRIAAVNAGAGGWSLNPAGRYGPKGIVLCVTGDPSQGGPANVGSRIKGIKFIGDGTPGLVRTILMARNTVDLEISDCSFSQFGMGNCILLGGCNNFNIFNNRFRDCYESGIYPSVAAGDAADCAPNVTAITTSDDFISPHGPSMIGSIHDNLISSLHFTGAGLLRHTDQSDGINLAQMGKVTSIQVYNNHISDVAEGMDIFERYCQIRGNHLASCNLFGLKFIYGAAFNDISNNTVINSGLAAIVLESPPGYETRNNTGVGNILYNAQSSVPAYADNSLIQLSSSGNGSTHSNSILLGDYAAVNAKTYVRNTANVGGNPGNVVGGRFNGEGKHADPNQRYCSHGSTGFSWG